MSAPEKLELLKDAVYQLYVNENRSKSYIARLFQVDRQLVGKKIREWDFPEPKTVHYLSPSNQKFINKNRQWIIAQFRKDVTIADMAVQLHVSKDKLGKLISKDSELAKIKDEYLVRMHEHAAERKEMLKEKSHHEYDAKDLPNEVWKDILGYEGYQVSNYGRIRHYAKRYHSYYLLTPTPNQLNGRFYVTFSKNGKNHTLLVARLVGFAFVDGYSETKNTINHIDGDYQNNHASNLEWISQAENNLHAYKSLHRKGTIGNQYKNKYTGCVFLYQDKYEFKTVTALAKFIGKSETQTRRYLEEPEKHQLKIIKKTVK